MSNSATCIIDDECEDCNLAVGVGQLLNVCKTLGHDDCEVMYDEIMSEDLSPYELVKIMKERSKDTSQSEIVSKIVELMA